MSKPKTLEPLPWFAFNVAGYVKDTMRLTTESHGAYLLLMLDYYATGAPCPDDDFILAAVAKLAPEAWTQHRKVLAPFFDIKGGFWHHRRIERELLEAAAKHATSIARAKAGGVARARKMGERTRQIPKTVSSEQQTSLDVAPSTAPSKLEAQPQASLELAHLHKHTTPFGRSSDDDATKAVDEVEEDIGTPISPDFKLEIPQIDACMADEGTTTEEVAGQLRLFIAYNVNNGSWSPNWGSTWALWWQRHLERRAKEATKAKPRVVVNVERPAPPTVAEWEAFVDKFKRGLPWSRQLGPDPDSGGCRAPLDILIKHGLRKAQA
jgi:uncharacterized protein YdaU (DUF1376 family)